MERGTFVPLEHDKRSGKSERRRPAEDAWILLTRRDDRERLRKA